VRLSQKNRSSRMVNQSPRSEEFRAAV
jgi:hypothetical protein